jgi:hypothetical protein
VYNSDNKDGKGDDNNNTGSSISGSTVGSINTNFSVSDKKKSHTIFDTTMSSRSSMAYRFK